MRKFYFLIVLLLFSLSLPAYTFADTTYTVKKGDSLYKISKKFKVAINEIKNRNELTSSRIKPGTKIVIPVKEPKQEATRHRSIVKRNSSKTNTKDNSLVYKVEDDSYYTVKKGDTLSALSKKFSIPVTEIREINDLRSTKLKAGQQLHIKKTRPKTYTVRKGDSIYKISRKFDIDVDELKDMNNLKTGRLKQGQKLFLELQTEPAEMTTMTNYEVILSEAQIDKEIQGVSESEELGMKDKLIIFAKKFINIPYRFGGNSLLGIDCSAFVKKVYGMIGINLPRSAREQFHEGRSVNTGELSSGDLVFFRTYAPFPSHVGIYLGDNLFIHASSREKKVTIDNLTEPFYIKRFIGAKRVIGEDTIKGG